MAVPALLRVPLALARRASTAIRRALAIPLLAGLYLLALPWLWVWFQVRGARATGWIARADRDVGSLDRLRQPY